MRDLVSTLSPDFVERLIGLLRLHPTLKEITPARVMREVANDGARDSISSFIARLEQLDSAVGPDSVALGLECALAMSQYTSEQSIEVVWTGPGTSSVAVRKSAAVLLGLIEDATSDLIVISFAAFRIPDALEAFIRAADRGVQLTFILESEAESSGRFRQYGVDALDKLWGRPEAKFYHWPKENRPARGLLHAKAVIADGASALVTSANLTENAIESNIELGVLVKGGDVPLRIHAHVMALINVGEFREVGPTT